MLPEDRRNIKIRRKKVTHSSSMEEKSEQYTINHLNELIHGQQQIAQLLVQGKQQTTQGQQEMTQFFGHVMGNINDISNNVSNGLNVGNKTSVVGRNNYNLGSFNIFVHSNTWTTNGRNHRPLLHQLLDSHIMTIQ